MDEKENKNIENETVFNSTPETAENSVETPLEESQVSETPVEELPKEPDYQVHTEAPTAGVETFDNKVFTTMEKAPKKKSKALPIVIAIIAIAAVAYAFFYFFTSNPKYVLVDSLDKWTDSLEKLTDPAMDYSPEVNWTASTSTGKFQFSVESQYLDALKEDEEYGQFISLIENLSKMPINVDMRVDQESKQLYMNLFATLNDEKIMDITYFNKDKKQYLLLKEVLEKYLELEEEADLFAENKNTDLEEEAEYVWDVVKKSLKKNIKSSYTTKTSEKVEVDGKNVNATKVTLVLDGKNSTELLSNVVKDLKADQRANEFITGLYPEFENYEVELSDDTNGFYYSVYITKVTHKIVRASIHDDEVEMNFTLGKNDVFEVVSEGVVEARATLKSEKDGFTLDVEFPTLSNSSMTITGKRENDKLHYDVNATIEGINISIVSDGTMKEIKKNESYQEILDLSISIASAGINLGTVKINGDITSTKGAKFEDVKESISIRDVSEEDQEKIMNYFMSFVEKLMQ